MHLRTQYPTVPVQSVISCIFSVLAIVAVVLASFQGCPSDLYVYVCGQLCVGSAELGVSSLTSYCEPLWNVMLATVVKVQPPACFFLLLLPNVQMKRTASIASTVPLCLKATSLPHSHVNCKGECCILHCHIMTFVLSTPTPGNGCLWEWMLLQRTISEIFL